MYANKTAAALRSVEPNNWVHQAKQLAARVLYSWNDRAILYNLLPEKTTAEASQSTH